MYYSAKTAMEDVKVRPDSVIFVLFGASGDLAKKKIYPALRNLYGSGYLPFHLRVVGFARSARTISQLKSDSAATPSSSQQSDLILNRPDFWHLNSYVHAFGYNCNKSYEVLGHHLDQLESEMLLEQQCHAKVNRIFYLAVPPEVYLDVTANIHRHGCLSSTPGTWNRVVLEKPFGKDLSSAQALLQDLNLLYTSQQLYFIDHYLGKDVLQCMLSLRHQSHWKDKMLTKDHVAAIHVSVRETIGIGQRAGYFDQSGIVRDMIQNHLMQMLCLVAMDVPPLGPYNHLTDNLQAAKVEFLKHIDPPDLNKDVILGQYQGYLDEQGIPGTSQTPTYAAIALKSKSSRWQGVPLILESGKRLNQRRAEMRVQFRPSVENATRKELVYCLQEDANVYMRTVTRVQDNEWSEVDRDRRVSDATYSILKRDKEAYERLVNAIFTSQKSRGSFVHPDEIREAWRILSPLLDSVENKNDDNPKLYLQGTSGPDCVRQFMLKHDFIPVDDDS